MATNRNPHSLAVYRKLAKRNGFLGCDISEAEIIRCDDLNLNVEEQECHINVDRYKGIAHINCSSLPFVTKLRKLKNFKVNEILVSPDDLILQLRGTMPTKAISFRGTAK
jgi:hypothetical protein